MRALGITLPRDRTKKHSVHGVDRRAEQSTLQEAEENFVVQRRCCVRRHVPDDTAAAVEHRPRDEAHEADAAAAVDQVDAPPHLHQ